MIRRAILSEAFIAGQAAGEADGTEVIADYGGRFGELLMEVLIGLPEEMDTAHGRLGLLSEVRGRSVHAAAHTARYPRFAGGTDTADAAKSGADLICPSDFAGYGLTRPISPITF